MPYADNDGLRIHYSVTGDGPPLVLQHGSTSSLEAWHVFGYVEALKPHYQLIMVDGRGHGGSDKPHDVASYALPLRVSDIVAVLDDLGIRKAHYWGYSMGGWIGFGMAVHAADRLQSLIIGGAHPYADRVAAFRGVDGTDPEQFVSAFEAFVGIQATADIRERILQNDLQALAAAMHDRDSLEAVISTMNMPCCLYVGEADPRLRQVKQCANALPNAVFVPIPGLNHAQANLCSDLILPPIAAFLQTII